MDEIEYNELIEEAHKYGSNNDWSKCIECYERAFKILIKINDLLDLAIVYLEDNNSFRANMAIDTVINAHPDDFRGYFYKGIYFEHLEEDDNALKYYLKALECEKGISEIYFKIGRIYDDQAEKKISNIQSDLYEVYDEAVKYYKKTLEIDELHFYANLNLGSIYEKQNRLEEALYYTNKSYESNPNEKMASYNLGVIYSKMNNYDLACKYYEEEITKKEFYPYAYYNLGILYKDIYKDLPKSREYYLLGLQYLKDDSSLWYNLACNHVLSGDFDNASDCFYCAISLNKKVLEYLEKDDEIKTFINSSQFENLKKRF